MKGVLIIGGHEAGGMTLNWPESRKAFEPQEPSTIKPRDVTPEGLRRMLAAKQKRDRRRQRNIGNEAAQGRYPEEAMCGGCGQWGEINYDDGRHRGYFCGGSDRCCP
ncbi:hypothetical protein [Stutzerimonas nitrititolerans]|uniref:hypothetical protein n=1 Tax=Stutzerimonas nitrititolerans TaxID=2482751 RepID=UPI0028A78418|nr:hypothetical protein [Stutzerimonas nitrititolerans]